MTITYAPIRSITRVIRPEAATSARLSPAAALRAAHLEAAVAAAGLDLSDGRRWPVADTALAGIAAEAYRMTAALTGSAPVASAGKVPPVVRLRELATAQSRLFAVLERHLPSHAQVHRSVLAVRALRDQLPD